MSKYKKIRIAIDVFYVAICISFLILSYYIEALKSQVFLVIFGAIILRTIARGILNRYIKP